jgi:Type IV secretion-system coupling protein DNA-binding domain
MPFVSSAYADHIGQHQLAELQRNHTSIGYHPETYDELYIPDSDRYAGTYVLGTQGNGKSVLLQSLIRADMDAGRAVIVIDAHGDLITKCLNDVPDTRQADTFLLDMEDESYPFGVNIFSVGKLDTSIAQAQAIERIMHIFEVLWADVLSQQNLPRYVRAAAITFLSNPGATLVDMHHFLLDGSVRAEMLRNVPDSTVRTFWQTQFEDLSPAERPRRVQPLIGRLEALFMGRSLVRNIVGQRRTTINFRKAIEQRHIVFIKLPIKTVSQDARLIGTILLAQIHAAVFSFGNVPEQERPGVSLYVDEFQHFATPDFSELFTEGRKFGARVTVAHQYRDQLPAFLQGSTMTARTKVCFQLTPEDGREMAHFFPSTATTIQAEDIEPHAVNHLLTYTPDNDVLQRFVETYLRPLQGQKRGNRVEIHKFSPTVGDFFSGGRGPNPRVADPTPYLDSLLYQVMRDRNADLPIPPEAVAGFSNCGAGFFNAAMSLGHNDVSLSAHVRYPPVLVVQASNNSLRWTRRPEGGTEQLFHFIFHLRQVMQHLASNPIGKETNTSHTDVAKMLSALPKRAAFVRSADTVGVIYTHNTAPPLPPEELYKRTIDILNHTRQTYCHPREEVEKLFLQATEQPKVPPVSGWEEAE